MAADRVYTPSERAEISELVRLELDRRSSERRRLAAIATERSAAVRGQRSTLRDRLQRGELAPRDFLFAGHRFAGVGINVDPALVGRITVHQLLTSLPNIGAKRALKIATAAGVDSKHRLEALKDVDRLNLVESIARHT